ncbi:unnamed protein product [Lactuca virosa]|uniref:Uncharacterized protein n=1 Tax=Lactuca virosa TaxID=75947 RepID=A0AAU9L9F2_9ASTR|nr:unnamed protein product [Lactuca virosa]
MTNPFSPSSFAFYLFSLPTSPSNHINTASLTTPRLIQSMSLYNQFYFMESTIQPDTTLESLKDGDVLLVAAVRASNVFFIKLKLVFNFSVFYLKQSNPKGNRKEKASIPSCYPDK